MKFWLFPAIYIFLIQHIWWAMLWTSAISLFISRMLKSWDFEIYWSINVNKNVFMCYLRIVFDQYKLLNISDLSNSVPFWKPHIGIWIAVNFESIHIGIRWIIIINRCMTTSFISAVLPLPMGQFFFFHSVLLLLWELKLNARSLTLSAFDTFNSRIIKTLILAVDLSLMI